MDDVDLDLVSADEKPRLSEVLDFESEIAPYPLTMIYAGLGSGKNTFAGFLMNGSKEYNLPKLNVLLITSRKAKVVETLSDTPIKRFITAHYMHGRLLCIKASLARGASFLSIHG